MSLFHDILITSGRLSHAQRKEILYYSMIKPSYASCTCKSVLNIVKLPVKETFAVLQCILDSSGHLCR